MCSGDLPHEINGKMCVGIVETPTYGRGAAVMCNSIGGVPVTVDTVAFAQQLAVIAVRVVELVAAVASRFNFVSCTFAASVGVGWAVRCGH